MITTEQIVFLVVLTLLYYSIGGSIDYWQSAMEHKKQLPSFLSDYFLVIWLLIYSGLFPALFVLIASNFNIELMLLFCASAALGSVLWDVVYSYLDCGRFVSSQKGYFVLKGKNYGLTTKQVIVFHGIRFVVGWSTISLLMTAA